MMIMVNLMMKKNKIIDKHLYHELKYVVGPYGPHNGKFICISCDKFIKWANRDEIKIYKKIVQKRTRDKKTTQTMGQHWISQIHAVR